MPRTRSAARAARSHRALASDDVLSTVFSFITPEAGFGAATACKTLRDAWRRRCRGMLRVFNQRIGSFNYSDHCVAYGDGVMVADYGNERHNGTLHAFGIVPGGGGGAFSGFDSASTSTANGSLQFHLELNVGLDTPKAVALRGDDTAWVLLSDEGVIVCVRLAVIHEEEDLGGEVLMRIGPLGTDFPVPESLVLAGDSLLVLCSLYEWGSGPETTSNHVNVYDNQTGAFLRKFSLAGKGGLDDPTNGTMAVQGDMLYVTCKRNNSVDEYRWRDGTLMRRFGGRDQPLSFNEPFGVAIRGKTMYISEVAGRRIQVLRLPDDDYSEPEILQVIPSPDDEELGGLCVSHDGNRLWCMGPEFGPTGGDSTYVHLFGPCY